ncbi:hypothetical protein V2A87_39890, partial [Pseudomonas aeruginosa]
MPVIEGWLRGGAMKTRIPALLAIRECGSNLFYRRTTFSVPCAYLTCRSLQPGIGRHLRCGSSMYG